VIGSLLNRVSDKLESDAAPRLLSGSRILTGVEVVIVVSGFMGSLFLHPRVAASKTPTQLARGPGGRIGGEETVNSRNDCFWTCSSERSGPGLFARLSRTGLENRNATCHSRATC